MALTITARLWGAIRKDEQANVFVSYCPTLKIYSQGRNEKEAKAALESAAWLFPSVCYERGILDEALKGRGLDRVSPSGIVRRSDLGHEFVAVEETFQEAFPFEVPLYLVAQREMQLCQQSPR